MFVGWPFPLKKQTTSRTSKMDRFMNNGLVEYFVKETISDKYGKIKMMCGKIQIKELSSKRYLLQNQPNTHSND
jgi:hypothetical protein